MIVTVLAIPVMLTSKEGKLGLDLDQNPNDLLKLLNPYPAGAMNAYEILTEVNKPANNYPEILDLISESMVLPG